MSVNAQLRKASEAADFIKKKYPYKIDIAVILGSGLGILSDALEDKTVIPYQEIPYFLIPTVEGHKGELVVGKYEGKQILMLKGRFHYYEGHDISQVTLPVRVLQELGIKKLIVTNASGGINPAYKPGDLMLIKDHINLMGINPLIGPNISEWGDRFPDMSDAYSKRLRLLAYQIANSLSIKIQEGVYVGVSGPNYETKAEVKFFNIIGGDAVGMSTVPEVIIANHAGMEVLGISYVANCAAKDSDKKISHQDVIEAGERIKVDFIRLLKEIIKNI